MDDNQKIKQIIKNTVTESIVLFFKSNLKKKKKFQILDLLIPRERNIRSIVGGLETSMGRTLWEPLAKQLATNNGFVVVKGDLKSPVNMPNQLGSTLQIIIESRESRNEIYDGNSSHEAIKNICKQFEIHKITDFSKPPRGNGVDVWLQKDGIDYFFDTKTVQPNVGDFKKFLRQILFWYGFFYSKNPSGTAIGKIVFPYNPYPGDFWKYSKGNGKPLEPKTEAWVEDEFWDFISGTSNTFDLIKMAFIELFNEKTLELELNKLFKYEE